MCLHSGSTSSHSHQQLFKCIFANILLSNFWILVSLIGDKWHVSVVFICPSGFMEWGWIVFLMLIIHLQCLYVKCLFIVFTYVLWLLVLLNSRGSLYIRKTALCLYELQIFFPSLSFWLCLWWFSSIKVSLFFYVYELLGLKVFYGFFFHIYIRYVRYEYGLKFMFFKDGYFTDLMQFIDNHLFLNWLEMPSQSYGKFSICILVSFWIFLFVDLFIHMLISHCSNDHIC